MKKRVLTYKLNFSQEATYSYVILSQPVSLKFFFKKAVIFVNFPDVIFT